jgi:dTDP-4-dehydrorhamnose 3,5-epimerase
MGDAVLSARDAAAPSLVHALDAGLLPDYATCRRYTESLASQEKSAPQ